MVTYYRQGVVAHTCNPISPKAESGGVRVQVGHSYTRPRLKTEHPGQQTKTPNTSQTKQNHSTEEIEILSMQLDTRVLQIVFHKINS